jgi:hypothetical protein
MIATLFFLGLYIAIALMVFWVGVWLVIYIIGFTVMGISWLIKKVRGVS